MRRLDRYVFSQFLRLFAVMTLGFPVLLVITDLAQRLEEYLNRQIPTRDLALSYVYWMPDSLFMVVPAAVLMATVFTITSLSRHAELTAAKASGVSFFRMVAPIFVGATLALGLDVGLGALAPSGNQRRSQLLRESMIESGTTRYNFVFAGEYGRVYKAIELRTDLGRIRQLQIERKGAGSGYPTYLVSADSAVYNTGSHAWALEHGEIHLVSDTGEVFEASFAAGRERHFTERPSEMMMKQRQPHDLTYGELTRVINATERSGGDANLLRVERALKIAIPATCLIIALFGAPLATSTERGGSGYGVAVSLATTMIFLVMVQLTRAVGGKDVITPELAAWVPNLLFGAAGLLLLKRVRT
ncbi:MAG TPA: LptF/LptG family permease [Gemmatimonadaceae bacterium]